MKTQKNLIANASQNIVDRLTWCTAQKDQIGITKDLASGKDIPEVYGLGEAGLFDEFFCFLDTLKISNLFKILTPNKTSRISNINFHSVLLIYMMRIVSGLSFFWHTEPVLLRSQSLMRLVGFNGVISILAANSFFPKRVHALLDSSEIQSTENCIDCGKVTKEKAPELRNRKRRIRKVLETIFGFKLWAVWDSNSKLPLAIRFTTIEVGDIIMAKEVVNQAINNLGNYATIASVAFDRGFLDGNFMWWLNSKGITFYVPAKTNMTVYEDALALVETGIRHTEQRKRTVGYGKNKQTEIDNYEIVGMEDLTSAGFYGSLGSGSHENSKNFVPNPINAVVVLNDLYKKNNPNSDTLIILTNASVKKPLEVYDSYDERSEIENSLFRESKQAWFIQRPDRNSANAFRAHVYLTIITMALTTAFRGWMDAQDKLEHEGEETGIRKFREKVREENGNKLIIFDENRYAIFNVYEVFILCNRNVAKPRGTLETITKEDILRKYGAALE
ncbi:transposase [Patescibacteria group bacterium]|nr:transposase [Patescibacteria group bacterium]